MKRTYIKRGIWHLGGRKKQKRGFLLILVALARPLLVSTVGAVGGEVLKRLGKKGFLLDGGERKKDIEGQDKG